MLKTKFSCFVAGAATSVSFFGVVFIKFLYSYNAMDTKTKALIDPVLKASFDFDVDFKEALTVYNNKRNRLANASYHRLIDLLESDDFVLGDFLDVLKEEKEFLNIVKNQADDFD